MFKKALVMVAAQGSTLVGSLSIPKTISVHRIALVVLHIPVNIHDLSRFMLLVDGIVHCVPCNMRGMTSVATPLAFSA